MHIINNHSAKINNNSVGTDSQQNGTFLITHMIKLRFMKIKQKHNLWLLMKSDFFPCTGLTYLPQ